MTLMMLFYFDATVLYGTRTEIFLIYSKFLFLVLYIRYTY